MTSTTTLKKASASTLEANRIMDRTCQLFRDNRIREGAGNLISGFMSIYNTGQEDVFAPEFKQMCLNHQVLDYLKQEATVSHSLSKPRGYSGDADMIDYYYRLKSNKLRSTYFGRELHNVLMDASSCASVRWRAKHLSELFQEIYGMKDKKIDVLSVASGHIRELGYVTEREEMFDRFIALDQDNRSNNEARSAYDASFLHILDESISYIIRDGFKDQQFDFVYSAGLFDYLNDKLASKLIEKLYTCVKDGGIMLVPNFAQGITERAFMDIFMDWELIYRTEQDMIALAQNAGIPRDKVSLYRDPMYNVIYMRVSK